MQNKKYEIQEFPLLQEIFVKNNDISIAVIVNSIKALVISLNNDPKIYIYHFDTDTKNEIVYDKDGVTAIDFCSSREKFIFGH